MGARVAALLPWILGTFAAVSIVGGGDSIAALKKTGHEQLLDAMEQDAGKQVDVLRVDGGASVSRFLMQFQADILRKAIDRPQSVETTAMGAAFLAGLSAGLWKDIDEMSRLRRSDSRFIPTMDSAQSEKLLRGWHRAVERSRDWAEE